MKNSGKKLFVWLLVLVQLLICTSLAETVATTVTKISNLTTFMPFSAMGPYTVRFLNVTKQPADAQPGTQEGTSGDGQQGTQEGDPTNGEITDENVISQFEDVAAGTPISTLMEQLPIEYENTMWSVTPEYLVLNNVDVFIRSEIAVAQLGDLYYTTLQAAIDAVPENSTEGTTVLLLHDTTDNIDTLGKSFTLDLGGHTLTAGAGSRAYLQNGGKVTILQGTITGADMREVADRNGSGAGIYVDGGILTVSHVTLRGNKSYLEGGGLYGKNSTIMLDSCTITGNTAENNHGAGISVTGGSLTAKNNTTISDNKMVVQGIGAALYADSCSVNLDGCNITGNESGTGSTLVVVGSGSILDATGLVVSNNKGRDITSGGSNGGCIEILNDTKAFLRTGCVVENNQSYFTIQNLGILEAVEGLVVKGNTGYMTGGIYSEGGQFYAGTLTLRGAQITNNTATYYLSGVGGVNLDRSNGHCIIEDCTFTGNTGSTGAVSWVNGEQTEISGCVFTGNTGTRYAGAIYASKTNSQKVLTLSGNTITSNTGEETGGVYVCGQNGGQKIELENSNKLYGNVSTNQKRGDDLVLDSGAWTQSICAANAMGNSDPMFANYTWIGGEGTVTPDVGKEISAVRKSDAYPRYYKAGVRPYVAYNAVIPRKYYTLKDALSEAYTGETITLIAEDENGNPAPISECVTVSSNNKRKNVTLDLNGRELYSTSTSYPALSVSSGMTLTLKGKGKVTGLGQNTAISNSGNLILDTDAAINKITQSGQAPGSMLKADGEINVEKVYLSQYRREMAGGKDLQIGSEENPGTIVFELYYTFINELNRGWTGTKWWPRTLIQFDAPISEVPLCQDPNLKDRIKLEGANEYVVVEAVEEDGKAKVIARSIMLNGVYVDGDKGDDNNNGLTKNTPVKTFKKAKSILEGLLSADSPLTPEGKAAVQGIYVINNPIIVDNDEEKTWSLPEGKLLMRYPEYTGYLAVVSANKTLTLENITLDGYATVNVHSALVKVEEKGTLNINEGAVLQNNDNRSDSYYSGGAVYCYSGTVNMSGGLITGNASVCGGGICMDYGTLTMTGGTISGNKANYVTYQSTRKDPTGGGVALLRDTHMTLNGGSVNNNTCEYEGGGISVGGLTTAEKGALLTMQSGTVNGNTSAKEGGGIHIQSDSKAEITGGDITHNTSKSGAFGGGGIYVNGRRNGTKGPGELKLYNVLIKNNHAGSDGGGLAGCSTSNTKIYVGNGGAIYGNTSGSNTQILTLMTAELGHGNAEKVISGYMLGGVPYNWTYADTNTPVPLDKLVTNGQISLANAHTDSTVGNAEDLAKVYITHNTAYTRGGGIGSNGSVQIGTAPAPGSWEWTPTATKTLTGRAMEAGEFNFLVINEAGDTVSHGKNTAADMDEAARIVFTPEVIQVKDGAVGQEFKFYITESPDVAKPLPSVTYDDNHFTVTVKVGEAYDEKTNTFKLAGYVTDIRDKDGYWVKEAAFENTYDTKPTSVRLMVKKTVQGGPGNQNFGFKLELPDQANAKYVVMPWCNRVNVLGTGKNLFQPITFTRPGEYVFIIRELKGEGPYLYDDSVWEATVTVEEDPNKPELKVKSITYSKVVAENSAAQTNSVAAEFENIYKPKQTTLTLPMIEKTISGVTPQSQKTFTFTLTADPGTPMPDQNTISITGAGKASFGAITYTEKGNYSYVVKETVGTDMGYSYDTKEYPVQVTVVDNGGKLVATWSVNGQQPNSFSFENQYQPNYTELQLPVVKTIAGNDRPEEKTFTFAIEAVTENAPMPDQNTVTLTDEGEAQFAPIKFEQTGIYSYKVREIAETGNKGYTYDDTVYDVTVEVEDNDGQLKATWSVDSQQMEALSFANKYVPSTTSVKLPVKKEITGSSRPEEKNFTFTIAAVTENAPMPAQNTISITGAGNASFGPITYSKAGTYSYKVQETAGKDTGYTYDKAVYDVTVEVKDKGGALEASTTYSVNDQPKNAIVFSNTYQPNAVEVKLPVKKEITGSSRPEEKNFTFTIAAVTENAPMPAQNTITITGAGNAEFGAIRFTQTGTWTYKVSETDGKEQNYVYDNRVYTITVRVTDDNGTLKAAWTTEQGSAQTLTFVNTYATPTPTPAPTPTPGPEYTTVRVTKRWQDADDADQIRPAYITVYLERSVEGNDYQAVESVQMTGEGNTWTYTFDQLPARNEQGQRYQYRVREDTVDGYAVQYDGYTITNTTWR